MYCTNLGPRYFVIEALKDVQNVGHGNDNHNLFPVNVGE